jgi:dinuclear metal center YbgI/SA1388 family protein
MIERGAYDNSGILVRASDRADKVLFALDLTIKCVERAKRLGCNLIVTHHPAIYAPLKELSTFETDGAVSLALKYGMNVISMHLNLDACENGIDHCLAKGLGAESYEILDKISDGVGYGRKFSIEEQTFLDFIGKIKKQFNTTKVLAYGKKTGKISTIASFCGSGASEAINEIKKGLECDVIVTSDIAHHELKQLIEAGKYIVILTHYASENYGFYKFFEQVKSKLDGLATMIYMDDVRFK